MLGCPARALPSASLRCGRPTAGTHRWKSQADREVWGGWHGTSEHGGAAKRKRKQKEREHRLVFLLTPACTSPLALEMFVSPFTVSLGCDAAIIVVYLQRSDGYGGTPWFTISEGRDYTSEMVDVVRGAYFSSLQSSFSCWVFSHSSLPVSMRQSLLVFEIR